MTEEHNVHFKYMSPSMISILNNDSEVGQIEKRGHWRVYFHPCIGWIGEHVLKRVVAKVGILNITEGS